MSRQAVDLERGAHQQPGVLFGSFKGEPSWVPECFRSGFVNFR